MTDPASLQNLHDIVTPAPVSWLPPAPGWYALGLTVALLLAWFMALIYQRWQSNRYRREALLELAQLEKRLTGSKPDNQAFSRLPQLLKRTAIAAYGRHRVASLSGDEWLVFLDETGSGDCFTKGGGRILNDCSCQPLTRLAEISQEQVKELYKAINHWIKKHSRVRR